jgi:hypothetical protein
MNLSSVADGLCVDANANQQYAYGSFQQWPCNSSDPFQVFWVTYASSSSYYEVQATGDNLCLDADANQDVAGGAIIQFPCNPDDPYQEWQSISIPTSTGTFYEFEDAGDSMCLDFDAQSASQGGAVIQWPCDYANGDLYVLFSESNP